MEKRATGLCLATLLAFSGGLAQPPSQEAPRPTVSEVQAQLRFLASDELAGRLTGTPGNQAAARYIAEAFRSYGLSIPEGWNDYLQPVPLVRVGAPSPQHLTIDGRQLRPVEDFLVISGASVEFKGSGMVAGHGSVTPESDDYQGLDATGKAVIVRFGLPGQRFSPRALDEKLKTASERGASALIEFYSGPGWERLGGYLGRSRIRLEDPEAATEKEIPHLLIRASEELDFDQLAERTETAVELSLGPKSEESVRSANVVGVAPGTDPALESECVVALAHYDHVGAGAEIRGATENDSIFNGARDNGMGVVALLAAARRIAALRAARTVVFLATTGEEQGLLGSAFFVREPVCKLEKTVFALNSDGAGFTDTSVATVLGLERTGAKDDIRAAAARAGLEAIAGPSEADPLFDRSDNLNFAQRGVPTVTFSPGFRTLDLELMRHYHQPSDEAGNDFDYAYLRKFAEAFANAASDIANDPSSPRWSEGDPYEAAAERLYGPR